MGFIKPKISLPPPPPPAPVKTKEEIKKEVPKFEDKDRQEEAKKKQTLLDQKRKGRKSTILTSYSGLKDDEDVIQRKKLLGE